VGDVVERTSGEQQRCHAEPGAERLTPLRRVTERLSSGIGRSRGKRDENLQPGAVTDEQTEVQAVLEESRVVPPHGEFLSYNASEELGI
jgi:hypothetical protein